MRWVKKAALALITGVIPERKQDFERKRKTDARTDMLLVSQVN